jgi:hypothetical protein
MVEQRSVLREILAKGARVPIGDRIGQSHEAT